MTDWSDFSPLFEQDKKDEKKGKLRGDHSDDDEDTPVGLPKGLGVSAALGQFFKRNNFTDVTFVVEDDKDVKKKERIGAHRIILAARSPVFEAMLFPAFDAQKTSSKETKEIELKGVKAEAFRALLQGVYTGRAEITPENLGSLSKLAKKYQVESVRRACVEFLSTGVTLDNAFLWFCKSAPGSAEKRAALTFIEDNASQVLQTEGILLLTADDWNVIAKSNQLNGEELELWEALMRWTDHQIEKGIVKDVPEEKRRLLKDIYPYVRFPLMSMEELISKVAPTRIVPSDHLLALYAFVGAKGATGVKFELHYPTAERNPRKPSSHFVWDATSLTTTWGTAQTLTVTDNGLVINSTGGSWATATGLVEWHPGTGIYEWELILDRYNTSNTYNIVVGLVPATEDTKIKTTGPIAYNGQPGWAFITGQGQLISQRNPTPSGTVYQNQCKQGDRVGIRLDTDTGRLYFFKNGVQIVGQVMQVRVAVRPAISLVQSQRVRLNFKCKFPKSKDDFSDGPVKRVKATRIVRRMS